MRVKNGVMGTGPRVKDMHNGRMTFGDTIKSSFCIKHKLLIQFKKIIFCFLLRLGRKEGSAGE